MSTAAARRAEPAHASQHSAATLHEIATQLRIDSVQATTAAGSGHPTSCASAAEIMAVLFFDVMRCDAREPRAPDNDVFVLSKGHAAPILYAAWAEAGAFPREHLLTLRRLDSDLEGHPTPRLPFVDVATGSLGQGLSAGIGLTLDARLRGTDRRTYVLMGDGESAEGSVWEAAELAARYALGSLCATIDVNRLGQSQPTMLEYELDVYRRRWESFGWQALVVDGHDIDALRAAYETASDTDDRPTIVLARTVKGKGLPDIEGKEGWHGKPLSADDARRAVAALEPELHGHHGPWAQRQPSHRDQSAATRKPDRRTGGSPVPPYRVRDKPFATRKAFGAALAAIGRDWPAVVAIDGDVENSTFTEDFQKVAPDRFFEGYIAEQNMVGMAMGLAARGRIPFVGTFGAFFSRAFDFVRMACIGGTPIKLAGTHVGVSIGEDGPSQMGLEDLAMMCAEPNMTVLYPADATSAWRATELVAAHAGPCYLRLGRPDAPILYGADEKFEIGRCKVLRQSDADRVLIVAGGVTVAEALAAHDELAKKGIGVRVIDLFSVQPIDREALVTAARACGGVVITVEDHYAHGGLGDAVLSALAAERCVVRKLAVREIPHSGKPNELLDRYGISATHIVAAIEASLR
ncbi:MAG TPA: transketolase [Gemmatimonadaceae bacterium]